jgi:hypothetical protein
MIVVITSSAPTVAFSTPAMPAHTAPTAAAARTASVMCSHPDIPSDAAPTTIAAYAPIRYWPWPPMLNTPARKASDTARPVRISGAAVTSVCCTLIAASARPAEFQGSSQSSPAPSKIAR